MLVSLACSGYARRAQLQSVRDVPMHASAETALASAGNSLAEFLLALSSPSTFNPPSVATRTQPLVMDGLSRRTLVQTATAGAGAASLASFPSVAKAEKDYGVGFTDEDLGTAKGISGDFSLGDEDWELIQLEYDAEDGAPLIFDIGFDSKPREDGKPPRGVLVGSQTSFYTSEDGGNTWKRRIFDFDEDEENYRFNSVGWKDGEGWVTGKPRIMLHTRDGGLNWEKLNLNPKLPGDPTLVTATGNAEAWMATSTGAIYKTTNAGRNFIAQVSETIDATLNRVSNQGVQGGSFYTGTIQAINRDDEGNYVAVPNRGNFYLTWAPGNDYWTPHNRMDSRRISQMGFIQNSQNKGMWMTSAGGGISVLPGDKVDTNLVDMPFQRLKNVRAGGVGVLDIIYLKDGKTAFAVGGSGLLLKSTDGGNKWTKNENIDRLPANLYKIKEAGGSLYALGSNGIVLKYKKSLA